MHLCFLRVSGGKTSCITQTIFLWGGEGEGGGPEIVMSFVLLKKSGCFKFVSDYCSFTSVPRINTIFQILPFSFYVSLLSEINFKSGALIGDV